MTKISKTHIIEEALEEYKAQNISVIDVKSLTDTTDHIIICTATSARHAKGMADKLIPYLKENNTPILGTEGLDDPSWILIDCIDTIIHIMLAETRSYYNLEKLWLAVEERRAQEQ